MKAKLNGRYFSDAMKYNQISIEGDRIKFHSYDGSGIGVIRNKKLENPIDGSMAMMIGEKDFKFISKLEELTIETEKESIKIASASIKLKIAQLVDFPKYEPELRELVKLSIDYEMLVKAAPFIGNESTRVQLNGVNILENKLLASDSAIIFMADIENQSNLKINVPCSSLKYIVDSPKIDFSTNGKMFVVKTPGRVFYTTLIANVMDEKKFSNDYDFDFEVDRQTLINELKMIKEFSDYVTVTTSAKKTNLFASVESKEISIDIKNINMNGQPFTATFNVKRMLNMANAIETANVSIQINEKMLNVYDESKKTDFYLARYSRDERRSSNTSTESAESEE